MARFLTPHMFGFDLKMFPCLKALIWANWAAFTLFLFTLPLLSDVFNDGIPGILEPAWEKFCRTPAEEISCGDGRNYTKIAIAKDRKIDGRYVGCGCGQGIFGDNACMVNIPENVILGIKDSLSVSYFIGTAPGTGTMAALSAFPILGMWIYGAGDLDHWIPDSTLWHRLLKRSVAATLSTFQVAYGMFLITTFCYFPKMHFVWVATFIGSLALHFILIAVIILVWSEGSALETPESNKKLATAIVVISALGSVGILVGSLWPVSDTWMGQHAFWLAEAIGLSTGAMLGPLTVTFGGDAAEEAASPPAQALLPAAEEVAE